MSHSHCDHCHTAADLGLYGDPHWPLTLATVTAYNSSSEAEASPDSGNTWSVPGSVHDNTRLIPGCLMVYTALTGAIIGNNNNNLGLEVSNIIESSKFPTLDGYSI